MDSNKIIYENNLKFTINISEKYKTISYTHTSTGSKRINRILSHFEFNTYSIINNNIKLVKSGPTQTYDSSLFEGHENYKLIMSSINPYRFFTILFEDMLYHDTKTVQSNVSIQQRFNEHMFDQFYPFKNFPQYLYVENPNRPIDHIIRSENVYEDLTQISWIKNSQFNNSGGLLKITNEKEVTKNYSKLGIPPNWKQLYSEKIADLVYKNCSKYFEVFSYDKDSWKI